MSYFIEASQLSKCFKFRSILWALYIVINLCKPPGDSWVKDQIKDKAILLNNLSIIILSGKIQQWPSSGTVIIRETIMKSWLERSLPVPANKKLFPERWWVQGPCYTAFHSLQAHSLRLLSTNKHTGTPEEGPLCAFEWKVLRRTCNSSHTMMKPNAMRHFSERRAAWLRQTF